RLRAPASTRKLGPAIALILLDLAPIPHCIILHCGMASASIGAQRWLPKTIGTIPAHEERTIMRNGFLHLAGTAALISALSAPSAFAQKKYDTGASHTEIKVGQTVPFSGPASAYATIGKTQAAYIKMINDQGGVNGRKITLIQYDDAYSPPKAVEQVR